MSKPEIWQIRLTTDITRAPAYAAALETFCPTVSWIDTDEDGVVEVEGITEDKPDRKTVHAALTRAGKPVPATDIRPLPMQDWLQLSFQSFPPRPLGRYWIHGSHIADRPPAGSWPLQIDAATAFGSGEHPTTAGCLSALETLYKRHRARHVLDMGTGSGILAIGALRAGARRVTGIDIDPESIRVTANHGRANRLHNRLCLAAGPGYATPLARRQGPYDLVLCNILARPLRQMAPAARRALKRGGRIILAGLLNTQATSVINAYRAQGFHLLRRTQRQEWTILEMMKP